MSSDVPQVRALLSALAGCIFISEVRRNRLKKSTKKQEKKKMKKIKRSIFF